MKKLAFKPGSFLLKCYQGISSTEDSGNPQYCMFCGDTKNEFLDPRSGRIIVLECDCERQFRMFEKFLYANVDWLNNPDSLPNDVVKYKDYHKELHIEAVIKAKTSYEIMKDIRDKNKSMC